MNLKNYLRGLGIGITVTALILLILFRLNHNTMTDEEIKARAAELGMVEEASTLSSYADGTSALGSDTTETVTVIEQPTNPPAAEDENGDSISDDGDDAEAADEASAAESGNASDNESDENKAEDSATSEPTAEPKPTKEPTAEPTATVKPTKEPVASAESVETPTAKPTEAPAEAVPGTTTRFTVNSGEDSYTVAKRLASMGYVASASDFDTYLCSHGLDRRIYAGNYDIPAGADYEELGRILSGR